MQTLNQNTVRANELIVNAKKNPAVSYWLKERLCEVGERDILDHMYDIEYLLKVVQLRWNELNKI